MKLVLVCKKTGDDNWKIAGIAVTIKWIENTTTQNVYGVSGTGSNQAGQEIVRQTVRYHCSRHEERKGQAQKKNGGDPLEGLIRRYHIYIRCYSTSPVQWIRWYGALNLTRYSILRLSPVRDKWKL